MEVINGITWNALDKNESASYPSKVFDTINPDLLLAEFKASGFPKDTLTLMCSLLKNHKEKVNNRATTSQFLQEFHNAL